MKVITDYEVNLMAEGFNGRVILRWDNQPGVSIAYMLLTYSGGGMTGRDTLHKDSTSKEYRGLINGSTY